MIITIITMRTIRKEVILPLLLLPLLLLLLLLLQRRVYIYIHPAVDLAVLFQVFLLITIICPKTQL